MKILVTGGSGLLGGEIMKLDNSLTAPPQEELDITNLESVEKGLQKYKPDVVLHLAAATNPPQHEKNPGLGLEVNVFGTTNVALACSRKKIRLVYTSSDYLYAGAGPHQEDEALKAPNNFYLSKLAGECAVRLCPDSLVLRLSFGPAPFPYEKVYEGQYCSKLYVDEMAPLVLLAAKSKSVGVMNLGGPRTSLEAYAKRTKKDIMTIPKPAWVPADLSLDLSRMKQEFNITDENFLLKH
jgi:dTDP-4-dehydrorhamnose reductase